MSGKSHTYAASVVWTGNTGTGTSGYRAYERAHEIVIDGKPVLAGSSDPAFRGDPSRHNPEDLLVASLSACHMLWYLHLASDAGICVLGYRDDAIGRMVEDAERGGWFEEVRLRPHVRIASGGDVTVAHALHEAAHARCFIANSVRFPVLCEPVIEPAQV